MQKAAYNHVTRDIRCQIYALKATGLSLNLIAKQVGKHRSTVYREIARNTGKCGYRYNHSDKLACDRRSRASQTPKTLTRPLLAEIEAKLLQQWSPEQIAGRLKLEGKSVSHESIYRHVRANKRAGGELYKHLRHKGKRYKKRSAGKAGRACIPHRVDITERPSIVEKKSRIGDWEADTVISTLSKTALLTVADRCSKYTLIKKIGQKTAENVYHAMTDKMKPLPQIVHTITYDNGMEFAQHEKISKALGAKAYFAAPYHSWERGLNEHTNGLIRQYLPKSFDFKNITDEEIQTIENKLNHRPRKVLQYKTPFEVFFSKNLSKQNVALHL